jgi:hypothetical protein
MKKMALQAACKPVLNPLLVYRREGDGYVFFYYDTRCIFQVSAFAGSLLLQCDGSTCVSDLAHRAAERYGLQERLVSEATTGFLQRAAAQNLIRAGSD